MKLFIDRILRTKPRAAVRSGTSLERSLGMCDLVVLGIGSMIGSGIYIMTGITAKEQTGPSIVVSFILASIVVLFIAACFTELASRLHKTGSTNLYLYLTVGELPAFVFGFGLLVLTVLSGATNARALSSYLDFVFQGALSNFTKSHLAEWHAGSHISSYPDVIAVIAVVLLTIIVACGVQCLTKFASIFVTINIAVLMFVSVCGVVFGNIDNWSLPAIANDSLLLDNCTGDNSSHLIDLENKTVKVEVFNQTDGEPSTVYADGFFPFGWNGVLQGAAACFWAFSGFEMISCAVEESRHPKRDIPLATGLTMLIVSALYVGTAAALTLIVRYTDIDTGAPLPSAIQHTTIGPWAHYIVSIGPLCGFVTTLMTNVFAFGRTALAMANDGLLYSWFAKVNKCTNAPVGPVLLCGALQAIIAFMFDIRDLIAFSVNIMLLSYASVCVCVIILRYVAPDKQNVKFSHEDQFTDGHHDEFQLSVSDMSADNDDVSSFEKLSEEDHEDKALNKSSMNYLHEQCQFLTPLIICKHGACVSFAILMMLVCMLGLAFALVYGIIPLENGIWWSITLVTTTSIGVVLFLCFVCIHRQTLAVPAMKVPCVPLIPSLAIFMCIVLLVSNTTKIGWIGCSIVLCIALVIYFTYSLRHSQLASHERTNSNGNATEEQTAPLLREEI